MTQTMYRRSTTLLEAAIDQELVALDRERGECFGFNETAAAVWRLLDRPRSRDDLVSALMAEFDVAEADCAANLDNLLNQMTDMKLIAAEN